MAVWATVGLLVAACGTGERAHGGSAPPGSASPPAPHTCAGLAGASPAPADVTALAGAFVGGINGDNTSYDVPNADQVATFTAGFRQAASGDVEASCRTLVGVDYQVRSVRDGSRSLLVLQEAKEPDRPYRHGWGLFVVDPSPASKVLVEIPHPCPPGSCGRGDQATETVGSEVFTLAKARFLFVAGASRGALGAKGSCDDNATNCPADAAHNPATMFEKVHEAALGAVGGGATVLQVHSWDPANHQSLAAVADVVVSSGAPEASPAATRLAGALRAQGFRACLFAAGCSELGATVNRQGRFARDHGDAFISVEVQRVVNLDDDRRRRLVGALAGGLAG